MKQVIFLAGIVAAMLVGGCASNQDRGGTYDHYDRNTGYERGQPPASEYPYRHTDGLNSYPDRDRDDRMDRFNNNNRVNDSSP